MRIAILGATSQIAKDLILSFFHKSESDLVLYGRDLLRIQDWLGQVGAKGRYKVCSFDGFGVKESFDAVINFVGSGDPARTAEMGSSILQVTQKYDSLAIEYLRANPHCRYLFLSSGAVYGSGFESPVDLETKATIDVNNFKPHDFYSLAKLYSECHHRSLDELSIVDIRVFNYFSHTQDMTARFLMTDIIRAIKSGEILRTSSENIARDFLHPSDFYQLVSAILYAQPKNSVVDAYTLLPVYKTELLEAMKNNFGLRYMVSKADTSINATGAKLYYYSLNRRAADFGYLPIFTSLNGVLREANEILKKL